MRATKGAKTIVVAVVVALLAVFAGAALAAPVGTDFRVSNVGTDGDTTPGAFNPDVAYNTQANEYLIVWYGDGDVTSDFEIYGQRVDASGNEIGGDFRISTMQGPGLARIGLDPAVAYNSTTNQYLVIWYGDGLPTDNEYEIWGQLVSATGVEVGSDFRISNVEDPADPGNGSVSRTPLRDPEVTYNEQANEYLVVWSGNHLTFFSKFEIWGQRVSAAGAEVGADFRISNTGPDNDPARDAENPVVAYNSTSGEYMVAWWANPTGSTFEYEIYGQVLSSTGAEVGGDFRISNVGDDGSGLRGPGPVPPSIAYNSTDNEYLVAWYGDDLPTADEYEVWGQLLSPAGTELGADFRISNVGTDGDESIDAFDPSVAYDSVDNEYLVAWYGDIGAESEICGQRISAAGAELGGDIRLSNVGGEGDALRGAFFPATAYNTQANEYLATWYADGLSTDDEFEVFARRVGGTTQACSSLPAPTLTAGQSSRRLTAQWTLPAGWRTGAIEAAISQETDADGFFLAGNTVDYVEFLDSTTTYSAAGQLPPGTYYLHVAAYNPADAACAADPLALDCVWVFSAQSEVTIPDDPPAPGPPPPAPPLPTPTPPVTPNRVVKVSVSGSSTQKALRAKAVVVRAGCDQACTLTASARVSVPGAGKVFRLPSLKRSLAANKAVTLRLKLSGKTLRAVKSALRKRKRVTANVTLTAKTAAGASGTSRKAIRIKR